MKLRNRTKGKFDAQGKEDRVKTLEMEIYPSGCRMTRRGDEAGEKKGKVRPQRAFCRILAITHKAWGSTPRVIKGFARSDVCVCLTMTEDTVGRPHWREVEYTQGAQFGGSGPR